MTEEEYFQIIKGRWPSRNELEPTRETIALCDQAVTDFPNSARLWVMRGDLIQLIDNDEDAHPLSEVERSYKMAIDTNPLDSEAYKEMGFFLMLSCRIHEKLNNTFVKHDLQLEKKLPELHPNRIKRRHFIWMRITKGINHGVNKLIFDDRLNTPFWNLF